MIHLRFLIALIITEILSCSSPRVPVVSKIEQDPPVEVSFSLRSMKLIDMKNKEFAWRNELNQEEYEEILEMEASSDSLEKYLKSQESNLVPSYKNFLVVQKLAGIETANRKFSDAIKIWEKYEKNFPLKEKEIRETIKILQESEGSIFVSDLGKEVNSSYSTYPVIEATGKKIFYTGVGFPETKGGEDIYEVILDDSIWGSRKPLTLLNTNANESASSLSIDGTELLITGNYSSSYGNGDIFASFLTDKGWTNVRHYRQPINTEYFDGDGFKTPDGKAILFVSDRPDGIFESHTKGKYFAGSFEGNTDIFISFRQESGSYGTPINLGPIINSPGSERAPFLHADGRTLYFSTNGLGGFGGMEIYKSVRLDDSWTNWSEPIHLGKFINSPNADYNFQITPLGDRGFTAISGSPGNQSRIVMLSPIPKRAKPDGIIVQYKGVIFNEYDNPIQAELEWVEVDDNDAPSKLNTKPTGEYILPLLAGSEYIIYPKKKNHILTSSSISLKNEKNPLEKTLDFKLVSIPYAVSSGLEYTLPSVFYDTDKDNISKRSFFELDRLAQLMVDNSELKIEILCHYSSSKPESYNVDLSNRRVGKVISYLISKNINSARLKGRGIGSAKPIVPNISEENRNKNRRTTIIFSTSQSQTDN